MFKANLKSHTDYFRFESMGTKTHELVINNGKKLDLSDLSDIKNLPVNDVEKKDYAIHSVNVDYEPEADCPEFKKFVRFLLNGNEKQIKTLQEFMGWLLKYPDREYKKALIILGVTNSGKSQLLETIEELFEKEIGDSVSNLSLPQIGYKKRNHLHKLGDSILNLDKDLSSQEIDDAANLKLVVSQEEIAAEPKYEDARKIQPKAKFMIAANVSPQIENQTDDAFYGRFLTVKAPNEVPREDREPDYGKKLFEEEGEGIFMWMLEGLQRLEENEEFTLDPAPYETKMSWMEFGDDINRFLWEKCEITEDMGDAIPKDDLYAHYENWVRGKLVDKSGKNEFKGRVGEHPSIVKAQATVSDTEDNPGVTTGDRIFRGIKLKESTKEKAKREAEEAEKKMQEFKDDRSEEEIKND